MVSNLGCSFESSGGAFESPECRATSQTSHIRISEWEPGGYSVQPRLKASALQVRGALCPSFKSFHCSHGGGIILSPAEGLKPHPTGNLRKYSHIEFSGDLERTELIYLCFG